MIGGQSCKHSAQCNLAIKAANLSLAILCFLIESDTPRCFVKGLEMSADFQILVLAVVLGEFAELPKETISIFTSLCLSVHPPIRMEQLSSHCTDFH